jgi:membrane dipeptidase
MPETSADALHKRLLVIDGLVFHSDGDASSLQEGNVGAVNLTVTSTYALFEEALDDVMSWRARAAAEGSPWHLVRAAPDIEEARRRGKVGLVMGWQNTRPFGDRLERIALFHELGLRVVQMTYNDAELFADGCLEPRQAGLSRVGVEAVAEMNRVGIAIDLSHCAEPACRDAARVTKRPVFLTHANAKAVHDRPRNKSDETLKAVAATGGVIGVSIHGFMNWGGNPKEPPTLDGWIRHVRHVVNLVGVEHVGFGTDFAAVKTAESADGFLKMTATRSAGAASTFIAAFGNTLARRYPEELNTPRLMGRKTAALLEAGFKESEVEKIMGRNFLRAFGEAWGR